MNNLQNIINSVEPPKMEQHTIKKYQNTGDIIKDLIACFKEYNYQAAPVSKIISTGNTKKDGKLIYDFIKKNIPYNAESEQDQTTKSFSRIINDAKNDVGHDCKHTALIVSSIAWNLGYTVIFKFVNYENNNNHFGHVYAIIENPKNNERAIIDTLQNFDYQKPYKHAVNYKAINYKKNNTMALSRLTGVADDNELNGIGETYEINGIGSMQMITNNDLLSGIGAKKKNIVKPLLRKSVKAAKSPMKAATKSIKPLNKRAAKKVDKKAKAAPKKAARKVKRSETKAKIKARGGIVKTVALAPVRAAGTLLIRENFRGFATRLKIVREQQPQKFADFAKRFGWKVDFLSKMVDLGAKKKALFGSKTNGIAGIEDVMMIEGIGAVALTSAVATAAPVILAITQLLKTVGVGEAQDATAEREAATTIIQETPDIAEVQELTAAEEAAEEEEEEEEAEIEEAEEEEEGDSLGAVKKKRKKFATALKKVELATKAVNTGASTYKKSVEPKKTLEIAVVPPKAQTFFEKAKESFKDKPLVWLGGTGALILVGNQIFKK